MQLVISQRDLVCIKSLNVCIKSLKFVPALKAGLNINTVLYWGRHLY